jgi:glutamyl-tRNA reductase
MNAARRPASDDPPLLLLGTDYRSSPIELREKVAYGPEETESLLVHLLAREEIAEAVVVSTCNRTEVYAVPRDEEAAYASALELVFLSRAPETAEQGRIYVRRNGEAARHLLGLACGLQSMVLGEPEILGQVKQAAAMADRTGASGTLLRRLLRSAAAVGGRARAETAVSAGAVSLGYAVVELARNIFTGLDRTRVLVIGAGTTAQLVARCLVERGAAEVRVTNRTPERVEALRRELPAVEPVPFAELLAAVASADVVVATTSAPEPLLAAGPLAAALRRRKARPLLVVDLGVPRQVEPGAARLESVFLYGIDALEGLIDRNLKRRREEVPKVDEMVDEELGRYRAWYRALAAEPLVARLQKQAERIRGHELETAAARFPPELHDDLDRLTRSLVRKILHHPSARLRARRGEEALPHLDLVRELFQLDDADEPGGDDEPER